MEMKSDIEIAQAAKLEKISKIAAKACKTSFETIFHTTEHSKYISVGKKN